MGMKLAFEAIDCHLFRKHPRVKIMLFSLCNYASEDGTGYMYNTSMARHCGVGEEQIRRYKRDFFEKYNLVSFNYDASKGKKTRYQIHLDQLQKAINLTPPESGIPYFSPHPQVGGTPPTSGISPTSRSGAIRGKELKDTRASAHDTDFENAAPASEAQDDPTLSVRKALRAEFGETWFSSWLVGPQIVFMQGEIVLIAQGPFGKGRVEISLETSSTSNLVRVITLEDYEAARK